MRMNYEQRKNERTILKVDRCITKKYRVNSLENTCHMVK